MRNRLEALMTTPGAGLLWVVMAGTGVLWGLTGPLTKVAISSGHHPVAISFWNSVLIAASLTVFGMWRGERPIIDRQHLGLYASCGLLGTALPNTLSYTAYQHLPVGIMVMLISLVPMATLLISWPLGLERPTPKRLSGILICLLAVALIWLPDSALPQGKAGWLMLPLMVAACYAGENVVIARAKWARTGPFMTLCGFTWAAVAMLLPIMLAQGSFFNLAAMGQPEQAILAISVLHLIAYAGFIWLIGKAGPVFASQVGYVVTGTGVIMGMLVYGETHSVWVWTALAALMAGLALVSPDKRLDRIAIQGGKPST